MSKRRTLRTRGEVIEEYSRDFPAEIVETYSRPLPGAAAEKPADPKAATATRATPARSWTAL